MPGLPEIKDKKERRRVVEETWSDNFPEGYTVRIEVDGAECFEKKGSEPTPAQKRIGRVRNPLSERIDLPAEAESEEGRPTP